MKWTAMIWLFLLSLNAPGQKSDHRPNLDQDPATLAKEIVSRCTTEKEKVTAIFAWITDNIAYYRPIPRNNKKRSQLKITEEPDDPGTALPSLTERIASKVLKDR